MEKYWVNKWNSDHIYNKDYPCLYCENRRRNRDASRASKKLNSNYFTVNYVKQTPLLPYLWKNIGLTSGTAIIFIIRIILVYTVKIGVRIVMSWSLLMRIYFPLRDYLMAKWPSVIGWLCFGKFKIKFIPMNDVGC